VHKAGEYKSLSLQKNVASFYARAFCQVLISLLWVLFLCIFIKPLIVGGFGMRLIQVHFYSLGINTLLLLLLLFLFVLLLNSL
jgi:hypothetical protein